MVCSKKLSGLDAWSSSPAPSVRGVGGGGAPCLTIANDADCPPRPLDKQTRVCPPPPPHPFVFAGHMLVASIAQVYMHQSTFTAVQNLTQEVRAIGVL
jgi:hypothetical protein